ncbi:hypothetical protein CCR75_002000 [Bremia lactucae]|uniref:VPS9 domain-containing protein n=1 Tax=Bremia lactucae TaxID=4779 RepID=A0A976FQQ3_BRELC|nr:hypothetical protein CCR75_002000 [Bremia lactucae]
MFTAIITECSQPAATNCTSPINSSNDEDDAKLLDSMLAFNTVLSEQSHKLHDVEQLQRMNEQLRTEVADLTSALLARDLELMQLRERCQVLETAREQPDQGIKALYTTNSITTDKEFLKTALPVLTATDTSTKESFYRVDSLSSTATASSTSSLCNELGEGGTKKSWTSSCSPPMSQRRSSFEQPKSSLLEKPVAMSAGFLRKSSRTLSGRLTVSDLGLFHNEDDDQNPEMEPYQALRASRLNTKKQLKDSYEDNVMKVLPTRSQSQRNLFEGVDECIQANMKQHRADVDATNPHALDANNLTYREFLQRLSLPASRDLLDKIRTFVGSILGPRGDGKPPRSTDYVEYDFYGNSKFRDRCNDFFSSMEDTLQNHVMWRHVGDATMAKARDGIEKYVMDKVSDIALNQLEECQQWRKEDEKLLRRMQILSFVTPAMLDIKPCMRNEVVWSMAEDELRRINSFRSPGDKIKCIVRCCNVIFSGLNLARGDSKSRPGADDFLPLFIYIVLHSRINRLHANCEYISAYRNQADLMSKWEFQRRHMIMAGYCFVNLRSAIEFIMMMDGSMLTISHDEFQRLYTEQEKLLFSS